MLPAQGCETFISNRSKDSLARMTRTNLGRTIPQILILPLGKGKDRKLSNKKLAEMFQEEMFYM